MGTVTIRNLDDTVIERLKVRARNHRRSLEAEIRDLLSHAAQQFAVFLLFPSRGRGT